MTKGTVAVLGPGGVGGLLAGLLARAGHRVVILARPQTAEALRDSGITVRSRKYGDFTVPVEARTQLSEPVDACLIAVKQTTLGAALDRVPPDVLGEGLVVPLLNGVDHMTALRARYPVPQVVAATIRVESARVAPGQIEHASPFAAIELASRTAPHQRLDVLAEWLGQAGLEVAVRRNETAILWDKLSFLAPLALLTTHAGGPVGTVRGDRHEDMLAVVRETVAVARACGATIEAEAILGSFERLDAGMKSSMLRDAEAGRALELDAIGGAVLRAAERQGLDVPVTARLVADLRSRGPRRPANGSSVSPGPGD
ncbi:MAG: 2-dehydropantoate 2-reductase [Streptosporangiaceae bacterium]|nr:2-dehydropantoate 2-reductase [Streptosporangiaceae bacterium]